MELEKLTGKVADICRETGKWIKEESDNLYGEDIESKGKHNYVTYVDKRSEEMLVEKLTSLLPGSGILAEEGSVSESSTGYRWIIDPLDGTTNYIHQIPSYSVSVGLEHDHEIISGVVFEPNLDECFTAFRGGESMLNGRPIRVSGSQQLTEALLATGFPYLLADQFEPYLGLFKELVYSTRGIRRLGSAALDLAYVACGRFDGFYEFGLNPWDVAAGSLIVKQAGGMVSDFHGNADYLHNRQIVTSNGKIHDDLLGVINRYFL
jgi:myo-inositol-1(or 4)-monophosphatase